MLLKRRNKQKRITYTPLLVDEKGTVNAFKDEKGREIRFSELGNLKRFLSIHDGAKVAYLKSTETIRFYY